MSNKPLRSSKRKSLLEKSIRSHAVSAEQKVIVEYLRLLFDTALTKWMAGVEIDHERLRGEAALLKELIQILSNAPLELVEGDN